MDRTYAVIMAGGVGSRFWPASRAASPKQLLDLTGSGIAMIAATVQRLRPDIPPERVIVVTGRVTVDAVAKTLPELPRENILAEPTGRNTAPCIGWAALHVRRRDPDGILAVMPSDHLVADVPAFIEKVRLAVGAARDGALVTFGIAPDRPETGFGYIEMGDEVFEGVRQVIGFVEKPDLRTAEGYLAAGNFAWNSGMFFFTANKILSEIETQMPSLMEGLEKIDRAIDAGEEEAVLDRVFPTLPSESVDYGIMEGARGILCVPAEFGWSDLGSWEAAYDLSPRDDNGNAIDADVVAVDSGNCLVRADGDRLIALVGVEDLVVVDTGDALLVCRREASQDVKKVVDALRRLDREDLL
jgi:mannose-1-phosphate guanylyltransferase